MRNANILPAGVNLTPQQKATLVNSIMGNPSIANQQGTSRVMYDTLPMDGRQEFRFFENVSNRTFPDTNMNQNKLQVGETFSLNRIYFSLVTKTAEGVFVSIATFQTVTQLQGGQFSVYFDTMQVVKPIPMSSLLSEFNHNAINQSSEFFLFDSLLTLPTDIQFRCELDTPVYTPADPVLLYLRCTWEGFGTILSPKNQF